MSPLDLVKNFLALAAAKDFDAALRLVAPDCVYHNMPMQKVVGRAAVRAVLEPFFGPTIRNELVILREMASGSMVFTERLDRHLMSHGWVELPVAGVWEIRDGLISLWHEYFDLQTLLAAQKA